MLIMNSISIFTCIKAFRDNDWLKKKKTFATLVRYSILLFHIRIDQNECVSSVYRVKFVEETIEIGNSLYKATCES